MKELPGDVFVSGQLSAAQIKTLAEQGVMSFINNRPDMEASMQPLADDLETQARSLSVEYMHIPMAGGISPDLISASVQAYAQLPRPIAAFCGSGMRSSALWAFAHVKDMGVDAVMNAITEAGYNLEQIRGPLEAYASVDQI